MRNPAPLRAEIASAPGPLQAPRINVEATARYGLIGSTAGRSGFGGETEGLRGGDAGFDVDAPLFSAWVFEFDEAGAADGIACPAPGVGES